MHKRSGLFLLVGVSAAAIAGSSLGTVHIQRAEAPVRSARVEPVTVAAVAQVASSPSAIASSIARWNSLRQSDNLPFSSYASFLLSHRGWPGETGLRRTAERQLERGAGPAEVIRFFTEFPPLTPAGHAGHAFALMATGRSTEAAAAARSAWTAGVLPQTFEQQLISTFGSALTPLDHDRRMEVLLGNGDTQSAQRILMWSSPARRPLFQARLAMQTRSSTAASAVSALGASAASDPGFLIDRANWLRNNGDPAGARQWLAQTRRLSSPPANPEKFMESMVTLARGAGGDHVTHGGAGAVAGLLGVEVPGIDGEVGGAGACVGCARADQTDGAVDRCDGHVVLLVGCGVDWRGVSGKPTDGPSGPCSVRIAARVSAAAEESVTVDTLDSAGAGWGERAAAGRD